MRTAERWLFVAFFLGAAGFAQPVEYDNTSSRYLAITSLVDDGRLDIDRYRDWTIDSAFARGHYYPAKGLGTLVVGAPAYWLVRKTLAPRVSGVPEPAILHEPHTRFFVRLLTTTLPFALLGCAMFRYLSSVVPALSAFWATAAYGLGTVALHHASLFSGHGITACLLYAAFLILQRPRTAPVCAAAGLSCGLAVLVEFPSALAAAAIAVYVVCSRGTRPAPKFAFIAAACACAAALAAYNAACFGGPFVFPYFHQTHAPFAEKAAAGLAGITFPRPSALAGLLVSPGRGILFISPVLLFALGGLRAMWREGRRADAVLIAAVCGGTILLISAYAFWHGGWTYGSRYLVYTLPFWATAAAWAVDGGLLFKVLFALSAAQVFCVQVGTPHTPEQSLNPIVELVLPLMRRGYTASTVLDASGGAAIVAAAGLWAVLLLWLPRAVFGLKAPTRDALGTNARRALAVWACCVVLGLAWVRSRDGRAVECLRAVLLADAASTTDSEPLALEARRAWEAAGGAARCGAGRNGL